MEKIKEVSDSSSRKNKEESFAKVAMGSTINLGNTITSTHRAIWTAVTQLGASRKKRPKLAQYTK